MRLPISIRGHVRPKKLVIFNEINKDMMKDDDVAHLMYPIIIFYLVSEKIFAHGEKQQDTVELGVVESNCIDHFDSAIRITTVS